MLELEAKYAEIEELNASGSGAALFSLWGTEDVDEDITERGYFGRGQEVFMVPHHLWTSGEPPLAKGMIHEESEGAVYRFKMNLQVPRALAWHQHLLFDLREGQRPIQVWSYGYKVHEGGSTPRKGTKGRRLHARADGREGCWVVEVSPVTAAAQPLSRTLQAKREAAEARQRESLALVAHVERTYLQPWEQERRRGTEERRAMEARLARLAAAVGR